MKINLYSDNNRECVIRVKEDIQELDIRCEEFSSNKEIDVECRLLRNNDVIRIVGKVSAVAIFECARCLEPFSQVLEGKFLLVARLMRKGETVPQYTEEDSAHLMYKKQHHNQDLRALEVPAFGCVLFRIR